MPDAADDPATPHVREAVGPVDGDATDRVITQRAQPPDEAPEAGQGKHVVLVIPPPCPPRDGTGERAKRQQQERFLHRARPLAVPSRVTSANRVAIMAATAARAAASAVHNPGAPYPSRNASSHPSGRPTSQ